LVIRLANENRLWGYDRIAGELLKLGYTIDSTTVKNVLKRAGIAPAPQRGKRSTWRAFPRHYKLQTTNDGVRFFTIETATLKTLYVLFFIGLGTRKVHVSGCTQYPDSSWVAQQARQLCWNLDSRARPMHFLIHDNDTKFIAGFDIVFHSTGVEVIHTPLHAPNANAIGERFVRTVRQKCLDQLVILSERHLRRVLTQYVDFYNTRRPHQGLTQKFPVPLMCRFGHGTVQRRDVLGGIIYDYQRAV